MSLIGRRVIVLETGPSAGNSGGALRAGYIRAASDQVYLNADISQIKVCVEFDNRDQSDVQWVNLTDSSVFQSVYINTALVWARRSLKTSGRNSVVGWPAMSFSFFAGEDAYKQMVVVEYFDDREKVILQEMHVRQLEIEEAVSFLTQQQSNMSCMLEELRKWDEHQKFMNVLLNVPVSLVGCQLEVFRCYSSPWFSAIVSSHDLTTREMVVTDCTVLQQHSIHPATVQVRLQGNRSVDDLLVPSHPRMERRSSLSGRSHYPMPIITNHHPPTDYPSCLGPWQSPPEQSSLPWLHNPPGGMGAGMGNVQNGMHYPEAPLYDTAPADDGATKRSTIEYQPEDSNGICFKKEPENGSQSPDKVLPDASSNNTAASVSSVATTPGDVMTPGAMNPPSMLPAKSTASVSFNTMPLPSHLQDGGNVGYGVLIRAESLPQINRPYAPCNFGLNSSKEEMVVDSFVPPQMPPRARSEFNLHINKPAVDFVPVLPKRPPAYDSYVPPAKRSNMLSRSYSQPNIHVASHRPNTTLDALMTILSEEQPELPDPEPTNSTADVFKPHDSDMMLPHNPWGYYPEPGQLSQVPALSMPVLSEGDRYQQHNYFSSPMHYQHVMRNSEPHLNQLPIQGGYPSRVPAIDRPPAQIVKPPEILEAAGAQESDQSSECSIIHYENRRNLLNSTGTEQRRSDGSDSLARTALHNFTGSLPNLANFGGEFGGGNCIYPRLDPECDPCDSVFSPVSGVNLGSVSRFDFNIRDGVKTSSSSIQEAKRGRGRPRLSQREKKQREELRGRGLIPKNKKRRSKEEMDLAKRFKAPGKRGRKAGFKRNSGRENWFAQTPTGSIVLQSVFCDRCPGVSQCRDCYQKQGPNSDYCRFLEFRRLRVDQEEGTLTTIGFADNSDVSKDAVIPWIPLKAGYSGIDREAAPYVLSYVAKNFITILFEELRAIECWKANESKPMYWRKAVKGVRELCDTCETTIFNTHWVCDQCGFSVCNTCYLHCLSGASNQVGAVSSSNCWPSCIPSGDQDTTTQPHFPSNLLLVHIIPDLVLWKDLFVQLVDLCTRHKITLPRCDRLVQYARQRIHQLQQDNNNDSKQQQSNGSLQHHNSESNSDNLLIRLLSSSSQDDSAEVLSSSWNNHHHDNNDTRCDCGNCYECHGDHSVSSTNEDTFLPRGVYNGDMHVATLCDNRLLWLKDPLHEGNLAAFQEHWRRGEPIIVSGIHRQLNMDLWTPQSFIRDFGNEYADLVDCYEGLVIRNCLISHFWDGFENLDYRQKNTAGTNYRLLKLKDWPTGDDFRDKLPRRYQDLSMAKPIPDYTKRDGKLNIASSLPDFFVRPDLGPKMYSAYGSASTPDCSTTNLHLDIADAVNVMVYCAIPEGSCDPNYTATEAALIDEVVARECCPQTVERLRATNERVGAIWHIYSPSDAPKIRALLAKACEENYHDYHQPPGTDPIHDQCFYLTTELRKRLLEEYGVQGYAIAQCVGDAVFIPAGAPHQVRNLCSCIKVAEDFVSPEHMSKCLQLTEEFRELSENHTNHEDKLQVKNILYHTIKDIIGILTISKAPITKTTKSSKTSSPSKLNSLKMVAGAMTTEGHTNSLLNNSLPHTT